jgi:hypothetical protein
MACPPKNFINAGLIDIIIENLGLSVDAQPPIQCVYPKAESTNAPYSVPEAVLTAGKLPPLILCPGTGSKSGELFGPNMGKLFKGVRLRI